MERMRATDVNDLQIYICANFSFPFFIFASVCLSVCLSGDIWKLITISKFIQNKLCCPKETNQSEDSILQIKLNIFVYRLQYTL